MGEYVDLNGVRAYYEVHGASNDEPLVLLHGGMATAETWGPQLDALSQRYRLYVPERRGHGHTHDVEGPLTYDLMAGDTVAFLKEVVGGSAHLVGWSDGGIVALHVALRDPDLVGKLVLIGANFHYEGGLVTPDEMGLTAEGPELAIFRSMYEAASPDGPEHWPVVVEKIIRMWTEEPTLTTKDLASIQAATLVLVGDDDMPALGHTVEMYESLPRGQLAVVPGASHFVPMERPALVNELILDFLVSGEPQTLMPMRRRREG
jgi:pimeloyl-ACP methyl ester carboxylesterase